MAEIFENGLVSVEKLIADKDYGRAAFLSMFYRRWAIAAEVSQMVSRFSDLEKKALTLMKNDFFEHARRKGLIVTKENFEAVFKEHSEHYSNFSQAVDAGTKVMERWKPYLDQFVE